MSENREIKINPELFSVNKFLSSTRKKRPSKPKEIKMKVPRKENQKTLKRTLLKFIRNQQDKTISNKLGEPLKPPESETDNFKSDFKDSLDYLTKLAKQNEKKVSSPPINTHNQTLKRELPKTVPQVILQPPQSLLSQPHPPTSNIIDLTNDFSKPLHSSPVRINNQIQPTPKYGCLKGGNLPTYRKWVSTQLQNKPQQPLIQNHSSTTEPKSFEIQRALQKAEPEINAETKPKYQKIKKRQRTLRRTYHIGKSKVFPKISVLVSNKTIRNNVVSKTHELKQTPLSEVKKFLIKKGFIKVGSIAPPDVLRKMYETVNLMCGDIKNHNPDNLLYNYFNDTEDLLK
jgi:hypothetical protein